MRDGWSFFRIDQNAEGLCNGISSAILLAASEAIPKSKTDHSSKIVPWWSKECKEAIQNRNRAFRAVKRTLNFQNLIEYKRCQAIVRKVVKKSKKDYWQTFCNTIGRTTPIQQVWGMIRRMRGLGREYGYPGMVDGGRVVTDSRGKPELIAKTLVKVHSSDNLSSEEREGRARTITRCGDILQDNGENSNEEEHALDQVFSITELNNALRKLGKSTPGRDDICYDMLDNLGRAGKDCLGITDP